MTHEHTRVLTLTPDTFTLNFHDLNLFQLRDPDSTQATWTQACEKGCLAGLKLGGMKASDTPLPPPVAVSHIFGGDFASPGEEGAAAAHQARPDFANMPRFGEDRKEWVVMRAAGSGRAYYRSTVTGEVTWKEPVGAGFGGAGT